MTLHGLRVHLVLQRYIILLATTATHFRTFIVLMHIHHLTHPHTLSSILFAPCVFHACTGVEPARGFNERELRGGRYCTHQLCNGSVRGYKMVRF
jgi:hypothetical protein